MGQARAVEGVLCQEEDGEAFLLHAPTGRYFGLNPAGLVVWRALSDGNDPLDALRTRWPEVPADVAKADTDQLLESLVEAGLLQWSP